MSWSETDEIVIISGYKAQVDLFIRVIKKIEAGCNQKALRMSKFGREKGFPN